MEVSQRRLIPLADATLAFEERLRTRGIDIARGAGALIAEGGRA